jgi:hypothetical protein
VDPRDLYNFWSWLQYIACNNFISNAPEILKKIMIMKLWLNHSPQVLNSEQESYAAVNSQQTVLTPFYRQKLAKSLPRP